MKHIHVKGFKAAGIASGIKKSGKKDLGLIYSEVSANAAGLFTRNQVQAAPVRLDRERITSGICQAVIVNSGNANCCTGDQGMRDARNMSRLAGSELEISEDMVLVASTGVIGEPLPIGKIEASIPELIRSLDAEGIHDFAEAIMTTDKVPKISFGQGHVDSEMFSVMGVAKGAGMIRPDMATMLCFVCTDANVGSKVLQETLARVANRSLNRITIDGDTSTNDTLLIMANGRSGATIQNADHQHIFITVLESVLMDLAKQLVKDGEGVTKLVEVNVQGASSDTDALKIAETIAHSPLVKTAFFGEDANWGRIVGAVGRAGPAIDPDKIDVYFDTVQMVKTGVGRGKTVEIEATEVLKKPEFAVTVDLNMGHGSASMLTCDFSIDYIKINADYRS
ncbi:MAG: bifunctional glutamate N-acetyltransferase/amino-acid acetyltransferase ArgJ [Deltaproteobacteria bacterium]|nr:bifunctional glutamate N-acetyltransferase/amino-acid acetyltransferase ArgJ [Deltaproteobacteria bacterium]